MKDIPRNEKITCMVEKKERMKPLFLLISKCFQMVFMRNSWLLLFIKEE